MKTIKSAVIQPGRGERGLLPLGDPRDREILDRLVEQAVEIELGTRCRNTPPRPIAARSMNTNSRGTVTGPFSFSADAPGRPRGGRIRTA